MRLGHIFSQGPFNAGKCEEGGNKENLKDVTSRNANLRSIMWAILRLAMKVVFSKCSVWLKSGVNNILNCTSALAGQFSRGY